MLQQLIQISDDMDYVREDLEAINDDMPDSVVTPPDKNWTETTQK